MTSITPDPAVAAPLSLRRNTAWNLAGTISYALCQWFLLIVIAHVGTVKQVGLFAFALACTAPIMLCANLQLRSLIATDARQDFKIGHYLAVRLFTIAIALAAGVTLATFVSRGEETRVIIAMVLAKSVEALSDISYGVLQRFEQMRVIAMSLVAKGVVGLGCMWLGLLISNDIATGVAAMAAGWTAVLLAYDLPQSLRLVAMDEIRPAWQRTLLLNLVRAAAPMGLVALLLSLGANLPAYFINSQLGTAELGHFTALSYLLVAGNLVIMAMGNAASPRLAKQYAAGRFAEFRALLRRMLLLCLGIGVAGVLASATLGRPLLALVYGIEYAHFSDVLVLLAIGLAITCIASVLGFAVTAARHLSVQLPIVATATLVCLSANAWLVPTHGLLGAAWSGIIMALALTAGYIAATIRVIHPASPAIQGVTAQDPKGSS